MSYFSDLDVQGRNIPLKHWRVTDAHGKELYSLPDNVETIMNWYDARKKEAAEKRTWKTFVLTPIDRGVIHPESVVVEFPMRNTPIAYTRATNARSRQESFCS